MQKEASHTFQKKPYCERLKGRLKEESLLRSGKDWKVGTWNKYVLLYLSLCVASAAHFYFLSISSRKSSHTIHDYGTYMYNNGERWWLAKKSLQNKPGLYCCRDGYMGGNWRLLFSLYFSSLLKYIWCLMTYSTGDLLKTLFNAKGKEE